jgi:hypothetical protein
MHNLAAVPAATAFEDVVPVTLLAALCALAPFPAMEVGYRAVLRSLTVPTLAAVPVVLNLPAVATATAFEDVPLIALLAALRALAAFPAMGLRRYVISRRLAVPALAAVPVMLAEQALQSRGNPLLLTSIVAGPSTAALPSAFARTETLTSSRRCWVRPDQ